jgi:hypothetical protein
MPSGTPKPGTSGTGLEPPAGGNALQINTNPVIGSVPAGNPDLGIAPPMPPAAPKNNF